MPFNDLHTDIIEIIFYIHVHINRESRRSLLLTCHRWHSVAINYTSLWRSIMWCHRPFTDGNPARCESLRGLAYLIARTGNATFDLSLGCWPDGPTSEEIDHFVISVGPNWLFRCRSLALTETCEYRKEITDLILRGSFDRLEQLTWHIDGLFLFVEFGRLVDHIGATAPRLQELEVACVEDVSSPLLPLICILGRMRRLRVVTNVSIQSREKHLTSIEHLDMYSYHGLFATLPSPHLTSLVLKWRHTPTTLPPTAILEKITHLTIQRPDVPKYHQSFCLPSLQSLTFEFSRLGSYSGILYAEKLHELTLVENPGTQKPILRFGPGVTPRIVNLDMPYDGLYQLQSLEYSFWINMVELHVTMCKAKSRIAATVTVALGSTGFAPQLRCLTVRYGVKGSGDLPQSQKREWVDQLLRIMAERVTKGMQPFERLEVGWFNLPLYESKEYQLDAFAETERFTYWTDCLRE